MKIHPADKNLPDALLYFSNHNSKTIIVSNNITDLPPAPTAPPLPDGWMSIYSYQIHKKYGFCYPLRIGDTDLYYDDKKLIESFDYDNDAPRIPESDIDLDVKVYISKDGALLRSIALQDDLKIKVGSREVLVFLENNEGDISSPAAHLILGNSAKKALGLSSVTGNIVDDLELDDEQEHQLRKAAHFSKASFIEELQTVLLENVINSKAKGKNSKQKRWLKFPDKLLNELTDSFFDTVIDTLKKLKISRATWDPAHKDHKGRVVKFINAIGKSIKAYENKTERYKAKLLKWRNRLQGSETPSNFNFAYTTLEAALGVLEMLSNILQLAGQIFEEIKAELTGTVQFWIGFLCGVINGIIDLISGLLFLLKLAVKALIGSVGLAVSSENRAVFIEQIDNIIQAFQAIEWGKVWERIKKGVSDILPVIDKAIREANPGQIGYFIGIVLFNIAEFFVPLTKLAKIAKTEKIFDAAQTVRASIARISGFTQQAGNDILRGLAQLAAFLRQGTDAVRKLVDDVFAGIKAELLLSSTRIAGRNIYSSIFVIDVVGVELARLLFSGLAGIFRKRTEKVNGLVVRRNKDNPKEIGILYNDTLLENSTDPKVIRGFLRKLFRENRTDDALRKKLDELLRTSLKNRYPLAWKALAQTTLTTNEYWMFRVNRWIERRIEFTFVQKGGIVSVRKKGKEIAEITAQFFKVKYKGYGGDIICPYDKTTTVIGLSQNWGVGRIKDTGTFYLISLKIFKSRMPPNTNNGGINVLNLPLGQWTWQKNKDWLKNAANRGDAIRLISDLNHPRTIWKNGIGPGKPGHNGKKTITGQEIDFLTKELNYKWDEKTATFIPKQ